MRGIRKVIRGAGLHARKLFPELDNKKYPDLPEELTFIHAEVLLDRYPNLPRQERETKILQECPAIFIIGIGLVRKDICWEKNIQMRE